MIVTSLYVSLHAAKLNLLRKFCFKPQECCDDCEASVRLASAADIFI